MADQAESSRRAPPMTPPPPPPSSPAIPEDSSSEAILWAASDDCSSSTSHTDLLSLWLSNYTPPPQSVADQEPPADVPTLMNFDLNFSFPDLVDWNTTSTNVMQAPAVTQLLWVHAPAAGAVDDLPRLAFGIQSPRASILPVTRGIQFPEASVSPLALGIHPSPVSFDIQSPKYSMPSLALWIQPPPASSAIEAPQASLSTLALGLQPPQAFFGTQSPPAFVGIPPPQAPISPLALETESSILPLARGIQFPEACISPPIPPLALGIQVPQISFEIQSAPVSFSSLPPIPCSLSMAPLPLWTLPSIPCTFPMALPLRNFPPSPSPVPERRNWSVFPSTPPPARQQLLLLPHDSASASVGSSSSHQASHQSHHFFPAANAGYQQQGPDAHAPVTFSTPNANADFSAGSYVPASRPSWSQAMTPRRSWTPNQPWINNGQDMKLPIPRRPRFLHAAAATMPTPPPLLANFGNFVGNTPSWNARGDALDANHQRIPTGESSRPSRKRSKLAART